MKCGIKCGIFTFYDIPNYGAVLQAYALCEVLRERGVDCEIIDYKCSNLIKRELQFHKSNFLPLDIFRYVFGWKNTLKKIKECRRFIQKSGFVGKNQYDRTNVDDLNDSYDVFISGSDMIWDANITGNDTTFFLDFVKNGKRYSYASSCSKADSLEDKLDLLKKYDLIAVREEDVSVFLNGEGINNRFVSDPTLLLDADFWRQKCFHVPIQHYVLVYFPSKDVLKYAKEYAKKHGKKVLVIEYLKRNIDNHRPVRIYNPYEWISYMYYADAVFTNSYHGILFALYFKKEFWTTNDCNRIKSLLQKVGINSRIIRESEWINESRIDYSDIEKAIIGFRKESLAYIDEMVRDIQGK